MTKRQKKCLAVLTVLWGFLSSVGVVHAAPGDGTFSSTVKIDENTANGPTAASLAANDFYGSAIANIGDLDGDGVQDFVVGARQDEGTDAASGAVYIHFMNTDGTIDSTVKIDENTANGPGAASLDASDFYGSSVAGLGDLDGDGVEDIVVGASQDEGTDASSGAIYIHYLNTDGSIDSTVKIDENTANGPGAANLDASDLYGVAVANIGDLDGDGVVDIAVGARDDEGTDAGSGAIYIHFMNANGTIDSTVKIDENTANGPGASNLEANDSYGSSIANIGDLNGDGVQDLAVGAREDEGRNASSGVVYIHFMNTNGTMDSTVRLTQDSPNGAGFANLDASDWYGSSVVGLGDVNGDGVEDIAVGAYQDEGTDAASGAFYIHFLNTDGSIDSTVRVTENTANGPGAASLDASDNYGYAIANLGDLDGNGVVDIGVGAIQDEGTDAASGAFYIHYLALDVAAPTVTIRSFEPSETTASPIPITIEFSEDVTGFVVGDIVVGNGTIGNFVAVDGNTYTALITPSGLGAVTVDIAGGVADDAAANDNAAAAQFTITSVLVGVGDGLIDSTVKIE